MRQEEWFKSRKFKQSSYKNRQKALQRLQELKQERIAEYFKNPKLCKECDTPLPYEGHTIKNFCSNSCSAKATNRTRSYKPSLDKRTKTIKCYGCGKNITISVYASKFTKCPSCRKLRKQKYYRSTSIKKKCLYCGNSFSAKTKKIKYCSLSCATKHGHKLGTISSWKSRNIKSYAERFFERVLSNNNIRYEINKPYPCGGTRYFLDFFIADKNIDLEIDGKQHNYPDRKTSDILRDMNLTKNGIKVYRIKWKNINTEAGKTEMKNKIDAFLDFYTA